MSNKKLAAQAFVLNYAKKKKNNSKHVSKYETQIEVSD